MKIPPVCAPNRISSLRIFAVALAAALGLGAASASAAIQSGAAREMEFAAGPASLRPALADAAELEALSSWNTRLERSLDADLAVRLDVYAMRALNTSMRSLAASDDVRLRRGRRSPARIDASLRDHSRTSAARVRAPEGGFTLTVVVTHILPEAPPPAAAH